MNPSKEIPTEQRSKSSEELDEESFIANKFIRNENRHHHHSFDDRNKFWNGKFPEKNSVNCSKNSQQQQNVLEKIIFGSETGINEFPW